jgi:predicted HAD superfamily Cof-like phosphohydrolase
MNQEQRAVHEFHEMIGAYSAGRPSIPPSGVRELRKRLIHEELVELGEALDKQDIVGVADALADLLVVVYGTGDACGLDLEPIFAEIHRSNMTKKGGPMRPDGKILKPEGWEPPELEMVIARQFDHLSGSTNDPIVIDDSDFEPLDEKPPYLEARDG